MDTCTVKPTSLMAGVARNMALLASAMLLGACGHIGPHGTPGKSGAVDQSGTAPSIALGNATPVTLSGAQEFAFRSAQGKDYRIFVAAPDAKPPAQGFPVLYLLDGNAYFIVATSAMQEQSTFASMSGVQPMIVVGVGYPGQFSMNRERRSFDFLPPANGPEPTKMLGAMPGGADEFLGFLVDELRPALAARYRIDPARQSLAGHSLGGYFALHALLRRPEAFRSYAAISPAIWWDDVRLLTEAQARVPSLTPGAQQKVDVLLVVAPQEMAAYPDLSAVMLSTTRSMHTVLAGAALQGVQTRLQELPAENHISTNLAAMSAILRQASGNP